MMRHWRNFDRVGRLICQGIYTSDVIDLLGTRLCNYNRNLTSDQGFALCEERVETMRHATEKLVICNEANVSLKGFALCEEGLEKMCNTSDEFVKFRVQMNTENKLLDGMIGFGSAKLFRELIYTETMGFVAKRNGIATDVVGNVQMIRYNGHRYKQQGKYNLPQGPSIKLAQESISPQALYSCPEVLAMIKHDDATSNIRNTVTMSLDGSQHQILKNYLKAMAHMRLWFISRSIEIDLSGVLGYEKIIYVVPDEGTFYLVLTSDGKSAVFCIDAREAWLYGAAGRNAICQFYRGERKLYITHEHAITLKDGGQYDAVAKRGPGEVPIGSQPIIKALSAVEKFDGTDDDDDEMSIYDAFGVIVANFLEPLKFHKALEIVCESIANGTVTTFNREDPNVAEENKKWGKVGELVGRHFFRVMCNENPEPLDLSNKGLEKIKTLDDALDHIFIMPRSFIPKNRVMQIKRSDSVWSPVDAGKGDGTVPLEALYKKVLSRIQSGDKYWRDIKFVQDRQKFFGHRLGGCPCPQALKFLGGTLHSEQQLRSISDLWKSKLPVKGNPLTKSVQIRHRFLKYFRN